MLKACVQSLTMVVVVVAVVAVVVVVVVVVVTVAVVAVVVVDVVVVVLVALHTRSVLSVGRVSFTWPVSVHAADVGRQAESTSAL